MRRFRSPGTGFMRDAPYSRSRAIAASCPSSREQRGSAALYRALRAQDLGKSLGELRRRSTTSQQSIKGSDVLADYAEKRLTRATWCRARQLVGKIPVSLRDGHHVSKNYTVELARQPTSCCGKYGKSIATPATMLKRVADMTIDLFVVLRYCRAATALAAEPGDEGSRPSRSRTPSRVRPNAAANNVRRIERNEDEEMDLLRDSYWIGTLSMGRHWMRPVRRRGSTGLIPG